MSIILGGGDCIMPCRSEEDESEERWEGKRKVKAKTLGRKRNGPARTNEGKITNGSEIKKGRIGELYNILFCGCRGPSRECQRETFEKRADFQGEGVLIVYVRIHLFVAGLSPQTYGKNVAETSNLVSRIRGFTIPSRSGAQGRTQRTGADSIVVPSQRTRRCLFANQYGRNAHNDDDNGRE
jgi:hypothetical protein